MEAEVKKVSTAEYKIWVIIYSRSDIQANSWMKQKLYKSHGTSINII